MPEIGAPGIEAVEREAPGRDALDVDPAVLAAANRRLADRLRQLDRVVVAFSGGVDSAFLARVAHDTLGPGGAHCVTAVSPSLATTERDECGELAAEWGLRWTEVRTDEMANAAYRRNDGDRCFWCKDAL